MKKQKYYTIKQEDIKHYLKIILGVLLLFLAAIIIIKILVPMVFAMCTVLLSLYLMYPTLDTNFKFIGACFLLVVTWKFAESFCYAFFLSIKQGVKFING